MSSQIKCYVINLDRSIDRIDHITQMFSKQGLNFERVTATDGTLLKNEELQYLTAKSTWQPKLRPSEIGCFLSHRECLRRIAESDEFWGSIFEDDVALSPNIYPLLQNPDWIPDGVDIVKLDTIGMICTLGKRQKLTISGIEIKPYRLARLLSRHYGAEAYIISKKCAKKLYEITQYVTAPIDVIYFDTNAGLLQRLNVQQMIPAPVIQAGMASTIGYSKKSKNMVPLTIKLARETRRIYYKNILATWQKVTRGYWTGKVRFE